MRQVVLVKPHTLELREVPAPDAGRLASDEILIRVRRIGICGSEIHSWHGTHPATFYPVVQGHEYAGTVVVAGAAAAGWNPGDRITARPQLVCGECGLYRRSPAVFFS